MDIVDEDRRIITRKEIFNIWSQTSKEEKNDKVYNFVVNKLQLEYAPDECLRDTKVFLSALLSKFIAKWNAANRHMERFLKYNESWLEEYIQLPRSIYNAIPSCSSQNVNRRGRPPKRFEESSLKTKRRKVQDLLESRTKDEIFLASEMSLRASGKRDAANIFKELSSASPKRATEIKKVRKPSSSNLTGDQALALLVDAKLSTHQYKIIRQQAKDINCNIYPPYYVVKEHKKLCYPLEDSIFVDEMCAEIKLQALLDHTLTRICMVQKEVLNSVLRSTASREFVLITKWGCDGSSGQSCYKQAYTTKTGTDESIFSISLVPIQIHIDTSSSSDKFIVWQNPKPSFTRYCRPIKFMFSKETTQLIEQETQKIQQQELVLEATKFAVNGVDINIKHKLVLTMVDGKVCNSLSVYKSSQKCYICGATPREMNNEDIVLNKEIDFQMLNFGLSQLHSWIRCFECLLHISYRIDVKKWKIRDKVDKEKVEARKKMIQNKFSEEMALILDIPKQTTGNTNDGNTARRFFKNPSKASSITGIKEDLIQHFRVILEAVSSGFDINLIAFEEYLKETRKLYIKNYSWYYMPPIVHKLLIHGKDIITSCILPIGQLSEEAQEARNKDFKEFREKFTRKTSRLDTNRDILNRLLISSDPLISNYRKTHTGKQRSDFSPEVLRLLNPPNFTSRGYHESDEDSSD